MQGFGGRTESVELDNSSGYALPEIYEDFKSELTLVRKAKNPIYTVMCTCYVQEITKSIQSEIKWK